MPTPANDLNITQSGFVTFDGTSTFMGRTLIAGAGITISNASGVAGNPTIALTGGAVAVETITGDSGSISGNNVTIFTNASTVNSGSTIKFVNSAATSTLNVTDTSLNNTMIGNLAGNATISGTGNTGFASSAGKKITSGSSNTLIGPGTGQGLTTGSDNICVGALAGSLMTTGSEAGNIIIGHLGVGGDSHTIRLGTTGMGGSTQNLCYIAGISGASPISANTPQVVLCDSAGNLTAISSSTAGFVLTSNAGATPSFQATAGGSSTYFQAYLTSTTNYATGSTANVVIFDTAISNVGSAYDTTTGIFTAPATGFYSFSATLFYVTGVGSTQFLTAYTGSIQSLRLSQLTVASAITSVSWYMPMTSGDTVKIQPFADGTGNFQLVGAALSSSAFNSASTFSGFRVA